MAKKQDQLTMDDIPDKYLEVVAREMQFSAPWQYDPDQGTYRNPDEYPVVASPEKDDPSRTRDVLQELCFEKATRNPQVATAIRGLVGRLAGFGFSTTSEVKEIQDVIEEIELDPRNRLYNFWPKYVARSFIEGELFLCLTCHADGFIEVDFVDPAAIQGEDDYGIIFHPKKTVTPLVYNVRYETEREYVDEQIPSIFIAKYPEWLKVASKLRGYSEEKLKSSRSSAAKFKGVGGFYRFIVSWDKSMITKRNIGHVRTVLQWIEHYELLKKYEIDWKKSVGAYVWTVQFSDVKSWIQWLKMDDADRRKTGIAAKKTPGGTMILGPNMEMKVLNPNLPNISESDTDILHMVTSGLNEPEDVATGQSKGTFASVKESRGPMSDRISDEVAYFERFLKYDFWGNVFFLKSKLSGFPETFKVEEAVSFTENEPVFKSVVKRPEQLIDINFPTSEINDLEARARALLGVKHAALSDTLGIPLSEIAKKMGFGNYANLRLRYEAEKNKYPELPLVLDAESIQEQVQAEPARNQNDEEDKDMAGKAKAGVPKKDGSGKGQRANQGRGGTPPAQQQKVGKGKGK
jgi:hypothetical protein